MKTEPDTPIHGGANRSEPAVDSLRRSVAANPNWYHTIDLGSGIVTPGHVDLRAVTRKILPADLSERRALDVGTFDGFWAFEMESRGASVVAIDIDRVESAEWPLLSRPRMIERAEQLNLELGRGFQIARRALDSEVERVVCNVYDLEPAAIGGEVDDVFLGTLLLHLRDPVGALERVQAVLKPGGRLHLLEAISMGLTLRSPSRARSALPRRELGVQLVGAKHGGRPRLDPSRRIHRDRADRGVPARIDEGDAPVLRRLHRGTGLPMTG